MLKTSVDSSQFNDIKIEIASPSDIVKWARGERNEVTKPETINYRNLKPEPEGLFCERIFGPVKDWECHCGKYKKIKHKGIVCEKCETEITKAKVRRERMGFINLLVPVGHIWYVKGVPSPISTILDIAPKSLDKILYYTDWIVTYKNKERFEKLKPLIEKLIEKEFEILREESDEIVAESLEETNERIEQLKESNSWTEEAEKALWDTHKKLQEASEAELKSQQNTYRKAVDYIADFKVKDIIEEDKQKSYDYLREYLSKVDADTFHEALDEVNNAEETKDSLLELNDKNCLDLSIVCELNIGGAAIKELLAKLDLPKLREETFKTSTANQQKDARKLEFIDSFIFSKAKPEWMMLECLPVISPELRPMVQLDGGRFATSDLNDLYRRAINRNNRLKKLKDMPFIPMAILKHEKCLLQEAVDAVLDNGKKQKPVKGSNGRDLKSLSDILKGKEGRFRKNLLGKRVDYSGRSVICVGPTLKIYQCGLPKEMALELFKPFVIRNLQERGVCENIRKAKKYVEQLKPEIWDSLEEVICEHPVLLNRAPTLHRLGIQAFEPQIVDGKAIRLHPLVCSAFNADFDGDQMAVHVPLSPAAQAEARALMLASHNLFSPATGKPIVAPSQDVVLGCYYLTMMKNNIYVKYADGDVYDEYGHVIAANGTAYYVDLIQVARKGEEEVFDYLGNKVTKKNYFIEGKINHKIETFSNEQEAVMAYYRGLLDVHDIIAVRMNIEDIVSEDGSVYSGNYLRIITVGRLVFNTVLPKNMKYLGVEYHKDEKLTFDSETKLTLSSDDAVSKKLIGKLITECYDRNGHDLTVDFLDNMKNLGYKYATVAGMSIAITDMDITSDREEIIANTRKQVSKIEKRYERGQSTESERRESVLKAWTDASSAIGDSLLDGIKQFNQISIITTSGARGSTKQISQLSGMRGLMSDPNGNPIEDLPVTSNFHEGLSVLEYFVSTHGARKGLADTALRTADAGYLTRRLVDVAQDVIVREQDCHTDRGIEISPIYEDKVPDANGVIHLDEPIENIADRIAGRTALKTIGNPDDILSEDIYKFYEPFLFEYESNDIITDEKPNEDFAVTTINTGLANPVIATKKHSEWKIDLDGEFSYILESELKDKFPITLPRTIQDSEGNDVSVIDTINYIDGNIVVTDYLGKETVIEKSLTKFDKAGEIDPRNAWVVKDDIISDKMAKKIDKAWFEADRIEKETGEPKKFRVWIRSPFTCNSKMGICSKCYGKDLSLKQPVEVGTAVGIIAAQSIGEPGTQLTMRTFHTGGVAGKYLTGVANVKKKQQEALKSINADKKSGMLDDVDTNKDNSKQQIKNLLSVLEDSQNGLLRVGELFEARDPKGKAITVEMDGVIAKIDQKNNHEVWIDSEIPVRELDLMCLEGFKFQGDLYYKDNDRIEFIIRQGNALEIDKINELVEKKVDKIYLRKKYLVPHRGDLMVKVEGQFIKRGSKITPGPLNPSQVLITSNDDNNNGELNVMKYIVEEIQKVYKTQGVDINDKHVEVIVRQMLRKVKITAGKDTDLKVGQILDKAVVNYKNNELEDGKRKAMYTPVLYGITDSSLNTGSFLSAASFQRTTRVLTDAAVKAKTDSLIGLKENVIIGRLIPAGTGLKRYRKVELLDKNGKPLPTVRYNYDPRKDKTNLIEHFEWKKGCRKCIDELGVKTVADIYPKLRTLSEWGASVEKEIQDVIRRHIDEQIRKTDERNKVLVDTDVKPNADQLMNISAEYASDSVDNEIEVDNVSEEIDIAEDLGDAEEVDIASSEYEAVENLDEDDVDDVDEEYDEDSDEEDEE